MKCNTHGEAKTCLNAIALVSLGLLLASPHGHAADRNAAGAGITWLPLPRPRHRQRSLSYGGIYSHSSNRFGENSSEIQMRCSQLLTSSAFHPQEPVKTCSRRPRPQTLTGQARVCCRLRNSRCFAIYLMIVCTTIQTNLLSPRPGATPAPGSTFTVRQTGGQCLCTFCAYLPIRPAELM